MRPKRIPVALATIALVLGTVGIAAAQDACPGASPPAAQIAVITDRNVSYGDADGQQLLVDIHRPPTRDTNRPGVLLFHGGGLVFGDRTWMDD
jgi:acetyl esterase/lipase